ncbi:ribonuclease R [Fodinisporobacter ferrooxydans]|uniref:Ribonuclease R n=1 Tax=Fodinisporobacter ferrooxydans TaxID=2901836 RepID=A0ABY4CPW3_9BACL|nr:ribonuclease R [Alicyclobacillaceae bacterium MYW30-H2]
MITEEQVLEFMREQAYKPLTVQELEEVLEVVSADELRQFMKLLNQMEERGQVIRTRTDRYGIPERMNLVVGKLQAKSKGFGFVISDEPNQPDLYVSASDMNGAMHGDRVMARIQKQTSGPRLEGEIIRIIERGTSQIVGTLTKYPKYGFVTPDDRRFGNDIFISEEDLNDAEDGQKVVVDITKYSNGVKNSQGQIVEILGNPNDPGVDILSVIRKYGLPEAFPPEVLAAAEKIPTEIAEEEIRGRRDLRNRRMVTIDGEDAKDLDDAVSVERLPNGNYLLGVHIADVGYYVQEGSVLDKEAYRRGCSVYLVDRVIPMLPHRLSNGICSLNPQVDRLTLTCDMEFTPDLDMVRHDIYPSVIKTNERMTYTNVRKILIDQDSELIERYEELVDDFRMMQDLAMKLRNRRMNRGAVDFDFQETKIIVNEEGKPVEIKKRERSIAEQIIEEFMLAANETVAEHFYWLQVPFLYRIHEDPDMEKMINFNEFIHNFGYHLKGIGNRIHPRSLQEILDKVKDTPEERIISTVMLRSLRQAKYAAESARHFGLSAEYYTHFTSPIRRYPDLVIHRIIREMVLHGRLGEKRHQYLSEHMADIAKQSSERERLAVEAERETDNLKKVEFMLDKIGEEFDGIISGVTAFGMFVELENSIEGLVHVSYLNDDYYNYHEKQYALVGERTGNIYRIGDAVRIRVIGASKETITIDFELITDAKSIRRKRRYEDTRAVASDRNADRVWDPTRKGKKKRDKKYDKSTVVTMLEPGYSRTRGKGKRTNERSSQTSNRRKRRSDEENFLKYGKSQAAPSDRLGHTADDYMLDPFGKRNEEARPKRDDNGKSAAKPAIEDANRKTFKEAKGKRRSLKEPLFKVETAEEFDLTQKSLADWDEEFGDDFAPVPNPLEQPSREHGKRKSHKSGLKKVAKMAAKKRNRKK